MRGSEFGARLREARKAAGFKSMADAAGHFGWNYNTVRLHETNRMPSREWLRIYCCAYYVSADWLLGIKGSEMRIMRRTNGGSN